MDNSSIKFFDFVIVGGGIAGVVCTETLCEMINPSRFSGALSSNEQNNSPYRVALISATRTVKTTINLRRITNLIEAFDVEETSGDIWSETWPNSLTVIYDLVTELDALKHLIYLKFHSQNPISYGRLCLTTGGIPRLISPNHPCVIALRDTESVETFQNRLRGTRRLLLVGNGGIATEIAHEVTGCQIVWAIKDASISAPFLDPAAAKFLLEARHLSQNKLTTECETKFKISGDDGGSTQIRRMRYVVASENNEAGVVPFTSKTNLILVPHNDFSGGSNNKHSLSIGAALGPDWAHGRDLRGSFKNSTNNKLLKVVYQVKVERLLSPSEFRELNIPESPFFSNGTSETSHWDDWPVYAELTNKEVYGCDLVVSAVGVEASFCPVRDSSIPDTANVFGVSFDRAPLSSGAGLLVNEQMETSVKNVYAAGDCAYANWTWSPHWFQMRLWNQARQMGFQAAKCMFGHAQNQTLVPLDFSFELFTHVTYFFGFKIVLLGRFNGQDMDLTAPDCYLLMRITPGQEYVKCVMQSGRMQGALLIGDTDLEETLENLIVNQLDLTNLEQHLLDPNIDLSDYFD